MVEIFASPFLNSILVVIVGCLVLGPLLSHAWPAKFDLLHNEDETPRN